MNDITTVDQPAALNWLQQAIARKETPEVLVIALDRFALNDAGEVVYRVTVSGSQGRRAGDVAGYLNKNGYRYIGINGRAYPAHRVAYALKHERWPAPGEQIDHEAHDKASTDPGCLRIVSQSANQHNQHRAHCDSRSGIRGISWDKRARKWRARIKIDGRRHHIGMYESMEAAGIAYATAKFKHQISVPIATAARVALDALGIDHSKLDGEQVFGALILSLFARY